MTPTTPPMGDAAANAASLQELEQPAEPERVARVTEENARLRAEVRQANARAQNFEAEARRVRASTKYQVGDLLVRAAKSPRKLFLLPRDLWRLYRLRKHRRTVAEETPSEITRARRSELSNEHAARLLLPRMAEAPEFPVAVGGAIATFTAHAWHTYAAVTNVLPHDAASLIGEADPDIVILDTAASSAGEAWSNLGNPAATDRAFAALDLVTMARERGRPVVLLRQTPPGHTAGLEGITQRCDLVVDGPGGAPTQIWRPGTSLDWWAWDHPDTSATPTQAPQPILLTTGIEQPRSSVLAGAMDWANQSDVRLTSPRPESPSVAGLRGALARGSFAIDPIDGSPSLVGGNPASWAALVSGLPVVTQSARDFIEVLGSLAEPEAGIIFGYNQPGDLPDALNAAAARGRLPLEVHWQLLRHIALHHTAPVTLTDLAQRLHLGINPGASRHMSLVIDPLARPAEQVPADLTETQTTSLIDAVLAQRVKPVELFLPSQVGDLARDALAAAGVSVLAHPRTVAEVAQFTTSAWVVTGSSATAAALPSTALLDLLIMAETTHANSATIGNDLVLTRRSLALLGSASSFSAQPPHPGWSS